MWKNNTDDDTKYQKPRLQEERWWRFFSPPEVAIGCSELPLVVAWKIIIIIIILIMITYNDDQDDDVKIMMIRIVMIMMIMIKYNEDQ